MLAAHAELGLIGESSAPLTSSGIPGSTSTTSTRIQNLLRSASLPSSSVKKNCYECRNHDSAESATFVRLAPKVGAMRQTLSSESKGGIFWQTRKTNRKTTAVSNESGHGQHVRGGAVGTVWNGPQGSGYGCQTFETTYSRIIRWIRRSCSIEWFDGEYIFNRKYLDSSLRICEKNWCENAFDQTFQAVSCVEEHPWGEETHRQPKPRPF